MKLLFKLLPIIFLVTLASCGGGDGDDGVGACSELKIANGESCESKENPVVALEMYNSKGGKYICSGSIITRTSVLTAAHCLVGYNTITISHRNASVDAKEGFYHGSYRGGVTPNDLAILKVPTEFTDAANFSPLPLNISQEVANGESLAIFGFGRNENDEIDLSYPKAAYVTFTGIVNGMISTVGLSGFARGGDSGGPAVYNNALLGVLSGSIDELQTNFYVNLRETSNYNFIMTLASDIATKSTVDKAINDNLAIKWTAE